MVRKTTVPVLKCYVTKTDEMAFFEPGQKVNAILNYQVIEKTRSFSILKINHAHLVKSKRRF